MSTGPGPAQASQTVPTGLAALPPVGPAPVPPVVEAEPAPTGKTPRFDFFTVLPEREFVVPDSEPATPAPPTPNAAPAANAFSEPVRTMPRRRGTTGPGRR